VDTEGVAGEKKRGEGELKGEDPQRGMVFGRKCLVVKTRKQLGRGEKLIEWELGRTVLVTLTTRLG